MIHHPFALAMEASQLLENHVVCQEPLQSLQVGCVAATYEKQQILKTGGPNISTVSEEQSVRRREGGPRGRDGPG